MSEKDASDMNAVGTIPLSSTLSQEGTTETSTPAVEETVNEECTVCMESIANKGSINSCDHKFCFKCIGKCILYM